MSVINTNAQALGAARILNQNQDMLNGALQRLSSGSKIINPSDDAGGLAVSEKMTAQNGRISAATTNVQNAISYVQTADGYLGGMGNILTRMSELATLAQDPTKNASDVANYQQEFGALQDQLRATVGGTTGEIGGTTDIAAPLGTFNDSTLFGPNPAGINVAIGQAVGQDMTIGQTNLRTGSILGIIGQDAAGAYGLNVSSPSAISTLSAAIQQLANGRSNLGASLSRLNLASSSLQVESQNLDSAISRISDVDVAQESTQFAKYNILVQAGTAMLAQANQTPTSVLQLLKK